jgi:hypothetical protein
MVCRQWQPARLQWACGSCAPEQQLEHSAAEALWRLATLRLPALQNKNSEFCAPLTSFDWNETDPKRLGTSSIDTTCTIWDIEVGQQGRSC